MVRRIVRTTDPGPMRAGFDESGEMYSNIAQSGDESGMLDQTSGGSARIVKPSSSPWSQDIGEWGYPEPELTLLFEVRGGGPPEPLTIFAGRKFVPAPGGGEFTDGEAWTLDVEWMLGNQTFRARMDLINGMTFSLVASALKVWAGIRRFIGVGEGNIDATVYAAAAYGIRPAHAPPQLTIQAIEGITLDGEEGENPPTYRVKVPAFARGVYLMADDEGAPDVMLYQSGDASILSTHRYQMGVMMSPLRIPLVNTCRYLSVARASSAAVLTVDAVNYVFDLAL
jgi:hypothetical protein